MKIRTNHFSSIGSTKEIIKSNGVKMTIRDSRQRFFYPDEWMAFYDQLKDKQKLTFSLLINTGARIMEAKNIKVSDIDFERGNIILRVTKRVMKGFRRGSWYNQQQEIDKSKIVSERKIRVLPSSSEFIKYLKKVIRDNKLNETDYLPCLSMQGGNAAMKIALQKAGIKDWKMFSLHSIRKTLETWLLALDIDSFKVIKHMGHSSAIALKHYVSPDLFSFEDKQQMRNIIGDLYQRS